MPAITSIVAKIMILVDAVLDKFVTVSTAPVPTALSNCTINAISGALTPCGVEIVDALEDLVYFLVKLGADMLPALGPIV
jgi:hypothetical protein